MTTTQIIYGTSDCTSSPPVGFNGQFRPAQTNGATMTPHEAIEKVKQALVNYKGILEEYSYDTDSEHELSDMQKAYDAIRALTIIEQNMLPELPVGASITITSCYDKDKETGERIDGYECQYTTYGGNAEVFAITVGEAVQNAIKGMEK